MKKLIVALAVGVLLLAVGPDAKSKRGYQLRSGTAHWTALATEEFRFEITCSRGQVAVSGGYQIAPVEAVDSYGIAENRPDGRSWVIGGTKTGNSHTLTYYALCR